MYNYVDVVLRKYRMGILAMEAEEKVIVKKTRFEANATAPKKVREKTKPDGEAIKKGGRDEELSDPTEVNGILKQDRGPDGVPLRRIPKDYLNNFYIDIVARSFTDVDKASIREKAAKDVAKEKKKMAEHQKKKDLWFEFTASLFK